MARKLIKTIELENGHRIRTYRDSEWNEYRNVYSWSKEGDSHHGDKADALSTAQYEANKFNSGAYTPR